MSDEYLLVDGYNIIFAWESLKKIADISLEDARDKLIDILGDYQGYKKINLILVFDAYLVKGGTGSVYKLAKKHIKEKIEEFKPVKNNMLIDNLDSETAAWLEKMRRG